MDIFEEIRPYRDNEVAEVIQKLIVDKEFIRAITKYQYPRMMYVMPGLTKYLVKKGMKQRLGDINTVFDFQDMVANYVKRVLDKSADSLTHSGLDKLSNKEPYLFISNHRDIAMDPALISYLLHFDNHGTTEIAIGDNLLKKEFVSKLMRLNKSFIVKRSAKGREKLLATKLLSQYIHHSIESGNNVWIAQREGRAKNGLDKTDPTIIKMFHMGKRDEEIQLSLKETIDGLNIIPVSISYEYNPCDELIARELYEIDTKGSFQKDEKSDVISIGRGVEGYKGNIHLHFGIKILANDDDATNIANQIDGQIIENYKLYPSNYLAYQILHNQDNSIGPDLNELKVNESELKAKKDEFNERYNGFAPELRPYFLQMYANPVINKLRITGN